MNEDTNTPAGPATPANPANIDLLQLGGHTSVTLAALMKKLPVGELREAAIISVLSYGAMMNPNVDMMGLYLTAKVIADRPDIELGELAPNADEIIVSASELLNVSFPLFAQSPRTQELLKVIKLLTLSPEGPNTKEISASDAFGIESASQ